MKLQITHLKAPWPEGAVVGDVLDLPAVPVWAVGKCKQVEDDAELTIVDNSDYVDPTASLAAAQLEQAKKLAVIAADNLSEDLAASEAKIAAALAEADKQAAEELAAIEKRKAKHK